MFRRNEIYNYRNYIVMILFDLYYSLFMFLFVFLLPILPNLSLTLYIVI